MKKSKEMICIKCNLSLRSITELNDHVLNEHKISFQEYSLKHIHSSTRPLCKCGCGKETPWHDCKKSYINFLKGHSVKPSGNMVKCCECEIDIDENGLGKHLRTHKIKLEDYIVKHEMNGIWPLCKCGCGNKVNWFGNYGIFGECVDGHVNLPERNAKISATVKKIYTDPEKRAETSRLTINGMNNEKTKSKMSENAANRSVKRVSQAEIEFVGKLRRIFSPEIVKHPLHKNFGRIHLIIDVFIECIDACVEFDGLYWHCLKLKEDKILSHNQCYNASADLRKNRLFRENKLTLIRIAEGLDLSGLKPTLESLIEYSHYATVGGKVLVDRMPVLSIDKIRESSKFWKNNTDVEKLIEKYESERLEVIKYKQIVT